MTRPTRMVVTGRAGATVAGGGGGGGACAETVPSAAKRTALKTPLHIAVLDTATS